MIPGMPGGRQFAAWLSSGAFARRARRFSAYAGVSCGPAGGPPARFPRPPPAPRPPAAPKPTSQTPVKSASLASAAQSAAVGADRAGVCPSAIPVAAVTSMAAKAVDPIVRQLGISSIPYTQSVVVQTFRSVNESEPKGPHYVREYTVGGRQMRTRAVVLTGALVVGS